MRISIHTLRCAAVFLFVMDYSRSRTGDSRSRKDDRGGSRRDDRRDDRRDGRRDYRYRTDSREEREGRRSPPKRSKHEHRGDSGRSRHARSRSHGSPDSDAEAGEIVPKRDTVSSKLGIAQLVASKGLLGRSREETVAKPTEVKVPKRELDDAVFSGAKKQKDRWASDSDEEGSDDDKPVSKSKKNTPVTTTSPVPAVTGSSSAASENDPKVGEESKSSTPAIQEGGGVQEEANSGSSSSLANGTKDLAAAFAKDGVAGAGAVDGEESEEEETSISVPSWNALLQGCRSVDTYKRLKNIDEGQYGVVYKAQDKETGEIVALKKVKMTRDNQKQGFPITALRETNILLDLHHPNVVDVKEMVVGGKVDQVFMVMEFMEYDLKGAMKTMKKRYDRPYNVAEIKCLMMQLLSSMAYMHERWYLHRDLKPSNLLINKKGKLVTADFGLARKYGKPIRAYTQPVITLWYRPPELLLGAKEYSTEVDMWSVGCIFAELLKGEPVMQGQGEINQLELTWKLCGSPNATNWPAYSSLPSASRVKWKPSPCRLSSLVPRSPLLAGGGAPWLSDLGLSLLQKMLALDPAQRVTAADALKHPYFSEAPLPCRMEDMPEL